MSEISMKATIRSTLVSCYKKYGLNPTITLIDKKIAEAMKSGKDMDAVNNICGELAEVVCEIMLIEFCTKHKDKSFYVKGLCLENKLNPGKTTELDLTLFTPGKIVLLESKFRKGSVSLVDECSIETSYSNTDVIGQNKHHLRVLGQYTEFYRNKEVADAKPYLLSLFLETPNGISDNREEQFKLRYPLLTRERFYKYLNSVCFSQNNWDVPRVYKAVEFINRESKANMQKHMARLKGGK